MQRALGLFDEQMAPSRAVLREHGNMSSATVLFILRRILHGNGEDATGMPPAPGTERVATMAFGPGPTVESALFTKGVAA